MSEFYCSSPWHGGFFCYDEQSVCCGHAPIKMSSPKQFLASEHVKIVKQGLLSGNLTESCQRCKTTEEQGGKSLRQIFLRSHELNGIEFSRDVDAPSRPQAIEVRLSNLCNFRCRICKPNWSSLIDREVRDNPSLKKWHIDSDLGHRSNDEEFIDDIVELIPDLKWINFTGGEPMIIPGMLTITNAIVEQGHGKDITLQVTTNVSTINPRIVECFSQFKYVQLTLSIDGVDAVAEYTRDGTNWPRMLENLEFYGGMRINNNRIGINTNIALSAYNVLDVHKVIEFVCNYRKKYHTSLDMIVVEGMLHPSVLSGIARTQAINSINKSLPILELAGLDQHDVATVHSQLVSVKNILETHVPDQTQWKTFKEYTVDLDQARLQNFSTVFGFDL